MRYLASALLILLTVWSAQSQTYEVGFMAGGANYIGDIGNTTYINPQTLALGGIVKWNRSRRHAFRASFLYAKIEGDDAKSNENSRQQRGYSFENSIKEASLGLEYTFWDYDVHNNSKWISTPYLYTGITAFLYDKSGTLDKGYGIGMGDGTEQVQNTQTGIEFAIPMVLGYKARLNPHVFMGFEIGARYTFTDNLDGSNSATSKRPNPDGQFGNINNDDWYMFTGITLTFAFGRLPCYCDF
ncbi:DUF6089 family protein [Aequorivita marina]|uniref:type IX secretion system protein PorG n=1 Tax=Aequorivita marina TaxID=3073654 RepID=UPI00287712B1|nr:DUF6089 family protein [Aequorivita sp. S2608]MDS1298524.1 DUF6089 family protein [Aequorivita sp. S2608]